MLFYDFSSYDLVWFTEKIHHSFQISNYNKDNEIEIYIENASDIENNSKNNNRHSNKSDNVNDNDKKNE